MLHWAFRQPGPVAIRYPRAQTAPFNGMIELNWEGSVAAQEIKGGARLRYFRSGGALGGSGLGSGARLGTGIQLFSC